MSEVVKGVASAFARAAAQRPLPRPAEPPPTFARVARGSGIAGIPVALLVWTLIVLMIVPDGFDYRNLSSVDAPASGGLLTRLLWLGLLASAFALLLWRAQTTWRLITALNPYLLGFITLAALSVLWSIEPAVTVRRMMRISTIVALAMAFATIAWHPRRFQSVLRPLITLVLLGSLGFGLIAPESAIHGEGDDILIGAWRGLANHKNGLGSLACIGAILWGHAWLAREVRLLPAVLGGLLALLCLLLSRSSTALVATLLSLLVLVLLARPPPALRRYLPHLMLLLIGLLLLYTLVLMQVVPGLSALQGPISAITGKDLTLTGRSEIWHIIREHIRLHPVFGTGYGAYWTGAYEGAASYDFMIDRKSVV